MWLGIRRIYLPLAVGRRIHPPTVEINRFKRIRSKKLSEAALGPWTARAASENPSTDRWIAWSRQLKDGFDGQLPMGEESIE